MKHMGHDIAEESSWQSTAAPVHGLALTANHHRPRGQKRGGAARQLAHVTACRARTSNLKSGRDPPFPILVPSAPSARPPR